MVMGAESERVRSSNLWGENLGHLVAGSFGDGIALVPFRRREGVETHREVGQVLLFELVELGVGEAEKCRGVELRIGEAR